MDPKGKCPRSSWHFPYFIAKDTIQYKDNEDFLPHKKCQEPNGIKFPGLWNGVNGLKNKKVAQKIQKNKIK